MTRVAAIDCGTNTIKLLVADLDPASGRQETLVREMRIVRLGEGVDRTGEISAAAMDRVLGAADEYAALVEAHGVEARRFVATSAARDARNAQDFAEGIEARLQVRPEVVSGDEEARLSFVGATRELAAGPSGPSSSAGPLAVVDIGGGSTEVVVGDPATDGSAPRVRAARSLDVGSVRLTERLLRSDPPTADECAAAVRLVDAELDTLPAYAVDLAQARTLVGVAGTVTTAAMLLLGLRTWDRELVHHASFPVADVRHLTQRLLGLSVAGREALGVPTGRSDVIGAGALILDRVLERSGAEVLTVSDSDILDGIAWSLV